MSRIRTSRDATKEGVLEIQLMSVNSLILPIFMWVFSAVCMFRENSYSDLYEVNQLKQIARLVNGIHLGDTENIIQAEKIPVRS